MAMQEGADQEPSGRRAMTMPDPAFPEKTKPALITWKTARPVKASDGDAGGMGLCDQSPRAPCRTAFGMALSADSGRSGSAMNDVKSVLLIHGRCSYAPRKLSRILAAFSASPGRLKPCTKSLEPLATFVELSFTNAVA